MSSKGLKKKIPNSKKQEIFINRLLKTGYVLVIVAVLLFGFIFYPTLTNEIKYFFNKSKYANTSFELNRNSDITNQIAPDTEKNDTALIPVNKDFSIVVPKIGANSAVIENVNPNKSSEYQVALTKGVAHAQGSSVPGEPGNTFLFAHSSDNFYNANRYNSVFYLLNKMNLQDNFYIIKDKKAYEYEVFETKVVEPDQVEYLTESAYDEQATLMTCWPPGTTLKRLVVSGKLTQVSHAIRE